MKSILQLSVLFFSLFAVGFIPAHARAASLDTEMSALTALGILETPSYCEYSQYSKEPACFATNPSYCEYSQYSKEGSCVAANPSYCQYSQYSKEPACIPYRNLGHVDLYCRSYDQLKLCPVPPIVLE